MTVGAKLGAFAVVLAASFGVGAAIGAALGPIDIDGGDAPSEHDMQDMPQDAPTDGGHGGHDPADTDP